MLIDPTPKKINTSVDAPKKVLKHKKTNEWINPPAIICTLTGAVCGVVYYWKKYKIKIVKLNDQYVFIKHIPKEEVRETDPVPEGKSNVKLVLFTLLVCVIGFYGVKKITKKPVIQIDMNDFKFLKDAKKKTQPSVVEPTPIATDLPDASTALPKAVDTPVTPVTAATHDGTEGDPVEVGDHDVLIQ